MAGLLIHTEHGVFCCTFEKDTHEISVRIAKNRSSGIHIRLLTGETVGHLMWDTKYGDVSIDETEYYEQSLVFLSKIGILLLKRQCPNLQYIDIEDTLHIECVMPNQQIFLLHASTYEVACHQCLFFSHVFPTVPYPTLKEWEEGKNIGENITFHDFSNCTNPLKKPPIVPFYGNNQLADEIEPIYQRTRTVRDFVEELNRNYTSSHARTILAGFLTTLVVKCLTHGVERETVRIDVARIEQIPYFVSSTPITLPLYDTCSKRYITTLQDVWNMDWKSFFESFSHKIPPKLKSWQEGGV